MKAMVALVGLVLLGLVVLSACSASAAGKTTISVSCEEFTQIDAEATATAGTEGTRTYRAETTLGVGDSLTVNLCSNPSTGFQWEQAKIGDSSLLEQVGHELSTPGTDTVGAAGGETWTFKALKKGKSTVSIDYSRPWEGGEKGVWKFVLEVDVK